VLVPTSAPSSSTPSSSNDDVRHTSDGVEPLATAADKEGDGDGDEDDDGDDPATATAWAATFPAAAAFHAGDPSAAAAAAAWAADRDALVEDCRKKRRAAQRKAGSRR